MQKFIPIWDRLLVEPCTDETTTSSGIVLTGGAGEGVSYGVVVSIGDGYRDKTNDTIPFSVNDGDKVAFWSGMGTKIRINGKDCVVLTESQLIGKIKEV